MPESRPADWDPRSAAVLTDQRSAYDQMRNRCPVAWSDYAHWSVFRHADVMHILQDHQRFSSQTSRHISVPNGMDPPQHTPYRTIIEDYFSPARMAVFQPICEEIAEDLALTALGGGQTELMTDFAQPFALRIQCAFMGWPVDLQQPPAELGATEQPGHPAA